MNTFTVKAPADWLVFKLEYERPHTWRSLNLRDPNGNLRLSHLDCYNDRTAVIHKDASRCSYLAVPGSIPAGEWRIEFAESWESEKRSFRFEWEAGNGELPSGIDFPKSERDFWTITADESTEDGAYRLHQFDWHECREVNTRWYKGDFHTHTVLSDGKMTPENNMTQAEVMDLDFFAVTDHNLLSTSWPKGKVLIIPGNEITSDHGHWNALGLSQWIDWRSSSPDGGLNSQEGMNRLMEEAGRCGALRSVNHPMLTPWAWVLGDTPLSLIDTLEVWNDPTYHTNPAATEKALIVWSTMWNEGYRVTGIGGSDAHMLPTESYREGGPPSVIGDPGTFVYADRLSAAAIMEAVQKGRVYVSRGLTLDIEITVNGTAYPLGSDVTEAVDTSEDGAVRCRLSVTGNPDIVVHVIENGAEISVHECSEQARTMEFIFDWKHSGYVWRRFDLRSRSGELLAFTNPVFYGTKTREITTWKQLLEKASIEMPVN